MSKLDEFIEQQPDAAGRVQGHVPKKVREQVDSIRKKKGWKWDQMLEAMFKRLIAEEK